MSINHEKSAERPLAGAVFCCTSVPPELRTRYADYSIQMGAEHKLDLTSDVTHLLVGDTDTPKYKYVAKEREDVKVLRPEFVEAVRNRWMEDKHIDLNELEAKYRMPPLAGLKICITGFDDLSFRAQLQKNVIEHGGQYSGDLTKDVTHLIAVSAQGKKYEYGVQWQKKVVTLQWYKDTLDRGMQLEETLYHPLRPQHEQGLGAWNRRAKRQSPLGKRTRDDPPNPEPARKLRRTASARLGSQNETMWTDIVGGAGFETIAPPPSAAKVGLKSAKSMPVMQGETSTVKRESKLDVSRMSCELDLKHDVVYSSKFLSRRNFIVVGFDRRREEKLREIIDQHGGSLVSVERLHQDENLMTSPHNSLALIPHDFTAKPSDNLQPLLDKITLVSELWLECCIFQKAFIQPKDYLLGNSLAGGQPRNFQDLTLNASGFSGLETLHISKMTVVLGARYEQVFTPKVSVLICNQKNTNRQKLDHAKEWNVPVVSELWLWACLKNKRKQPFEPYLLQKTRTPVSVEKGKDKASGSHVAKVELLQAPVPRAEKADELVIDQKVPVVDRAEQRAVELSEKRRPGDDGAPKPHSGFHVYEDNSSILTKSDVACGTKSNHESNESDGGQHQALQEMSPNSSRRPSLQNTSKTRKALFRSLDGHESIADSDHTPDPMPTALTNAQAVEPLPASATNGTSLNGAIEEMLSIKARAKVATSSNQATATMGKSGIARTLSNMSAASACSNVRRSRASSIDTMNTDGIGSEIVPDASGERSQDRADGQRYKALIGRAKTKLAGQILSAQESAESMPYSGTIVEEEPAPQLTQLVYEDPEESIMLREKLAEKRRQKSRLGQRKEDPKPAVQKDTRKIRDDDLLGNAGWGVGRRTRHKDRTPPGLKDF